MSEEKQVLVVHAAKNTQRAYVSRQWVMSRSLFVRSPPMRKAWYQPEGRRDHTRQIGLWVCKGFYGGRSVLNYTSQCDMHDLYNDAAATTHRAI